MEKGRSASGSSSHDKQPLRSAIKSSSTRPSLESERTHIPLCRQGTSNSILPVGYTRGVAFDLLDAVDAETGGGTGIHRSFTLQIKSEGYRRTKNTRQFLIATDLNEYSVNALNWLLSSLIEDGDEMVVLRVVDPGPPTADPSNLLAKEMTDDARDEALAVLSDVLARNPDRKISIIIETAIGLIQETIQRMLQIYKPDSLVVGTRGRTESMWKTAFMGSTSRYCLAKSPVPVIVVRPERKIRKSLEARKERLSYSNIVATRPPLHSSASTDGHVAKRETSDPVTPAADKRTSKTLDLFGLNSKSMRRFKTAPS